MNRIEALAEWMKGQPQSKLLAWQIDIEVIPALTIREIYHAYMFNKDLYTFDLFTKKEIRAALLMASHPEPLPDMAARLGRIREAALRLQAELTVLLETLGE